MNIVGFKIPEHAFQPPIGKRPAGNEGRQHGDAHTRQGSLEQGAFRWTFEKAGRSVRVPVNGRYQVSSSLAVRDALRAGFGLSLIPWIYVREDLEAGRLCTVLDDWSPNEATLYAVYPSKRYVMSKVRAFLDFLVEEFGEDD